MYWSSVDITVNCHKFCNLHRTNFIFSQHRRSEVQHGSYCAKIKASAGLSSSWKPKGRVSFLTFPSFQRWPDLPVRDPFPPSSSQRRQFTSLPTCHFSSSLSSASLFRLLGPLGPHWVCLANPGDSCRLRVS